LKDEDEDGDEGDGVGHEVVEKQGVLQRQAGDGRGKGLSGCFR
jgi:hypothetical protein